jgi:hypothetical protein
MKKDKSFTLIDVDKTVSITIIKVLFVVVIVAVLAAILFY